MPRSRGADEPALSATAFQQRCKTLAGKLARAIGISQGGLAFSPSIDNTVADMKLAGRDTETIVRNLGGGHRVIPLCQLSNDVFAWTGYYERWKREGNQQKFRFMSGGFTLHVGRQGEVQKPQVLRSEWAGPRSQGFAQNAGHPHWQLDVLQSVRGTPPHHTARFGHGADEHPVKEFNTATAPAPQDEYLMRLGIERMHFASAAMWWSASDANIAHAPANVDELDRWILSCAAYLQQEFKRCVVHPLR